VLPRPDREGKIAKSSKRTITTEKEGNCKKKKCEGKDELFRKGQSLKAGDV